MGTTYCHWIAYLKQYIEADPPTDYPGGQYPVDRVVFIIDNGNGWAFPNLDMKQENRGKAVIKAKWGPGDAHQGSGGRISDDRLRPPHPIGNLADVN